MGAFFAYTIYSSVFLLFLFLFYKVLLSNEKQIMLNRIILLSCYALAFAAWPISQIEWKSGGMEPQTLVGIELPMLKEVEIEDGAQSRLPQILIWIYIIGALLVLLKTLFSTTRLLFYIRKGRSIRMDDYTLVVMPDNDIAPFSFGRKIVMSESDYETVRETVTVHELAHIQCRHYLDLIIAQVVCVVLWYNPAAWMMLEELKLLHEYQADAKVIDRGVDISEYQMLLIRKTVGNRVHTLANNLNHSKLKDRIAMMQKEKSGGMRRMRVLALAIAPMVAFGVMNLPAVASDLKSLEETSVSTVSIQAVGTKSVAIQADSSTDELISAEFPGGEKKLMEFLAMNLRYPQSAMQEGRSGRTIVGYTIGTDGSISNIKILKSSSPDLDEEAMRVVKKMPYWNPSMKNGKAVAIEFALPVNFRLPSSPESDEITLEGKTKLEEVVVVGYGSVQKDNVDTKNNNGDRNSIDILGKTYPENAPIYIDGVLSENGIEDVDIEKVKFIQLYREGDEKYPNGAVVFNTK